MAGSTVSWIPTACDHLFRLRGTKPGWGYRGAGPAYTEPTVLGCLALLATRDESITSKAMPFISSSAKWLATMQQEDGAVGVSHELPTPAWPTAYAALLWTCKTDDSLPEEFQQQLARARKWLLRRNGKTFPRQADGVLGHDTSIPGWPWVTGTHPWLEPTAVAILALCHTGEQGHQRTRDGVRMLLDRAIPGGGWNMGNSTVFGRTLRPQAGPTGLALLALRAAGHTRSARCKSLPLPHTNPSDDPFPGVSELGNPRAAGVGGSPSRFRPVVGRVVSSRHGVSRLPVTSEYAVAGSEPNIAPVARSGVKPDRDCRSKEIVIMAEPPQTDEQLMPCSPNSPPENPIDQETPGDHVPVSRHRILLGAGTMAVAAGSLPWLWKHTERLQRSATFIARAQNYDDRLEDTIRNGLQEIGFDRDRVQNKSILLKPNLVEPTVEAPHVNTHPALVRAVAEVFRRWDAREVFIAEGQGHIRDAWLVLEQSGLEPVLREASLEFVDLNHDDVFRAKNRLGMTPLDHLYLPKTLRRADIIVSLPKMKTHHWAGVTLSMKNLFGVMPGICYGWPKNVLHHCGIGQSILDITATVQPHLAIVDGIVGMEGDGPIMGTPRQANLVVMGTNLPAVDATTTRLMGLDPQRLDFLRVASGRLGPICERHIEQRGELIADCAQRFKLDNHPHFRQFRG